MTDACYLARGAQALSKPTKCEECFAITTCKMYANFKQLEVTASDYAKLLALMDLPTNPT